MSSPLQKLVIFCPLPPKPNGIADYLAEQLPYFVRNFDVTVVIENDSPQPVDIPNNVSVLYIEQYMWCRAEYAQYPHLYHVGNNRDTQYMLEILLSTPGIVMVHDLNLHYLIDLTNLSIGDKASYTKALYNQYGSAGKVLGKQLSEYGWKGGFMPHELMMNSSIIDAASHIIVHSKYSADKIKAIGHQKVSIIPHHLSPKTRKYSLKHKMTYRGQLGLPGNKVVITSMGFIAKAKQIKAVLLSLKKLKEQGLEFVYVLAGQCKPHEYDVYQDIADCGLQDHVIVTGFLEENDFFKYLCASDFIVNLRYPSGGETSGTLTRAMGLGLACVVVDIGPFGEIPKECALKLTYDEDFQTSLTKALSTLIEDNQLRANIGISAKRWVQQTQEINVTTNAYGEVVKACQREQNTHTDNSERESLSNHIYSYYSNTAFYSEVDTLMGSSEFSELIARISGVTWWSENVIPMAIKGNVLCISESFDDAILLSRLFKYDDSSISHIDPFEITNPVTTQAKLVVNISPLRAMENDPIAYLSAINVQCAVGAVVILSFINDGLTSSTVDLQRSDLEHYIEAAGFSVEDKYAGQRTLDIHNRFPLLDTEEWTFVTTKCSRMVNKAPKGYGATSSNLALLPEIKQQEV
tara:strand:+ start:21758 stop:23662 length:1905 start_codon:yes stop_codon:yes gene_type:complete